MTGALDDWWAQWGLREEAPAWLDAGFIDPHDARKWAVAGFGPDTVPEGFEPDRHMEYEFVTAHGLPVQFDWGRLVTRCSGEFAREAFDQGQDPVVVGRLADALLIAGVGGAGPRAVRLNDPASWDPRTTRAMMAIACALAGANWEHALVCVEAGMRPWEAVSYAKSGRDLDPVRLLAALGR